MELIDPSILEHQNFQIVGNDSKELHAIQYEHLKDTFDLINLKCKRVTIVEKLYEEWGEPLINCFICLILDKKMSIDYDWFWELSRSRKVPRSYAGISTSQHNALKVDFKYLAACVGRKGLFSTMSCKKPSEICKRYMSYLALNVPNNLIGVDLVGVSQRACEVLSKLKAIQSGNFKTKKQNPGKINRVIKNCTKIKGKLLPREKTSINVPEIDYNKWKVPNLDKVNEHFRYVPLSDEYKVAVLKKPHNVKRIDEIIAELRSVVTFSRERLEAICTAPKNFPKNGQEICDNMKRKKRSRVFVRTQNEKIDELVLSNKFDILNNIDNHLDEVRDRLALCEDRMRIEFVPQKNVFKDEIVDAVRQFNMINKKFFKRCNINSAKQSRLRYNLMCFLMGYPHEKLNYQILKKFLTYVRCLKLVSNSKIFVDELNDMVDNAVLELPRNIKFFCTKIVKNLNSSYTFKKRLWIHSKTKRNSTYRFKKGGIDHIAEFQPACKKSNTRKNQPHGIASMPKPEKPKPVMVTKPVKAETKNYVKTHTYLEERKVKFCLDQQLIVECVNEETVLRKPEREVVDIKELIDNSPNPRVFIREVKKLIKKHCKMGLNNYMLENYLTNLYNNDWNRVEIDPTKKLKSLESLSGEVTLDYVLLASNLLKLHNAGIHLYSDAPICIKSINLLD